MSNPTRSRPEKWILLGIPVLFVIGSLMHFAFQLLWENPIVGLIAPVNESIWEHAKLLVWPMILWWVLYDRFRGNTYDIDRKNGFRGHWPHCCLHGSACRFSTIFTHKHLEAARCGWIF